jgi:hypothetical protein
MVVVIRWTGTLNLYEASECLPLFVVDNKPSKKGKKITIPYYGTEEVIVSIRYKKKSRGLREMSKQSDNFVSLDLQIGARNVHIKLSKTNALVMGVTSVEQAIEAVDCVLDMITMTDENLSYLRDSLAVDYERCHKFVEKMLLTDENVLPVSDFLAQIRAEPDLDERICLTMLAYAYEYSTAESFVAVMKTLISCDKIDPGGIDYSYYEISNSLFSYKLRHCDDSGLERAGGIFMQKELALAVMRLGDENVIASHHNWASKYVNMVIVIPGEKASGHQIHRFNISEKGSVRQWSPSSLDDTAKVHSLFLKVINMAINDVSGKPCLLFPVNN